MATAIVEFARLAGRGAARVEHLTGGGIEGVGQNLSLRVAGDGGVLLERHGQRKELSE